ISWSNLPNPGSSSNSSSHSRSAGSPSQPLPATLHGSIHPTQSILRVLIRNLDTGTFFKSQTEWAANSTEAFDFQESDRAIRVGRDLGLKNLEIQFISDEGKPLFG